MSRRPSAVVVGGGIAGATVALALRERGAAVIVVEAARAGRATPASAGLLTPLYEVAEPSPLVRLGLAGLERWPAFADRLGRAAGRAPPLRRDGLLVACFDADEEATAADAARRLGEAGLPIELLPGDGAREEEPAAAEARAWLWLPTQGRVDAQAVAELLPAALGGAGVDLREGVEATALLARGGAASGVRLADGEEIRADRVVLAAGAWSAGLAGLPRALPVRPVRGQMIRYAAPAVDLGRPLADGAGRYVVPHEDGGILAGSTMEDAGFEAWTTAEGLDRVREGAIRLLPALGSAVETAAWAGLRPVTADGAPILGPDPEVEGLLYATGYGRNGILVAPVAGDAVAAAALGEDAAWDLEPFRPDRFG